MTGGKPNSMAFSAGDGKERQPRRIEQQDRRVQPVHPGIPEEGDEPGQNRNQQVPLAAQGGRRYGADQDIPGDPP